MNPQDNQPQEPPAQPQQPVVPQLPSEPTPMSIDPTPPQTDGKGQMLAVIGVIVVSLLGGLGAGAWYYISSNTAEDDGISSSATDTPATTDGDTKEPAGDENVTITKGTGELEGATIYTYMDKKIPTGYPSFLPKFDYAVMSAQKTVKQNGDSWTILYTSPAEGTVDDAQKTLTAELKKQGFTVSETTSRPGHIQIDDLVHENKRYVVGIDIMKVSETTPLTISVASSPK